MGGMMNQTVYLPLRSTVSLLGLLPPLCLLLAVVCLQQQWITLCLFLVCIFILKSIFNCLPVVTGGYTDEIFLYNPVTDSWTLAGRMSTPRYDHAVTVLPNIENMCRF